MSPWFFPSSSHDLQGGSRGDELHDRKTFRLVASDTIAELRVVLYTGKEEEATADHYSGRVIAVAKGFPEAQDVEMIVWLADDYAKEFYATRSSRS